MPDYKYQGTSRSGSSVSGVMTASNKTELASILKRQQITATKMTEKGKEFNIPTFGGGVSSTDLAIFTPHFRDFVCRPVRGSSASHPNRHRTESLHREHFRLPAFGGRLRRHFRAESLVWHAARPFYTGHDYPENAGLGHPDEEDRCCPLYANSG